MSDVLDRVRKLLAQANDSAVLGTPEEEIFRNRALKIMAKHGLTETMIAARNASSPTQAIKKRFKFSNPHARPKRHLMTRIAMAYGCQVIYLHASTEYVIEIFGFEDDIQRADWLFDEMWIHLMAKLAADPEAQYAAYRNAAIVSFADYLSIRLTELEDQAITELEEEDGIKGTEIVLQTRKNIVAQAVNKAYPKLGKASKISISSRNGMIAGRRIAREVTLNPSIDEVTNSLALN